MVEYQVTKRLGETSICLAADSREEAAARYVEQAETGDEDWGPGGEVLVSEDAGTTWTRVLVEIARDPFYIGMVLPPLPPLGHIPSSEPVTLTRDEMLARFGDDQRAWVFTCPSCGTGHTLTDLQDLGLSYGLARACCGCMCIGRFAAGRGCGLSLDEHPEAAALRVLIGNEEYRYFPIERVTTPTPIKPDLKAVQAAFRERDEQDPPLGSQEPKEW